MSEANNPDIECFREFLRIPTISQTGVETGSYVAAAEWLSNKCLALGLETKTLTYVKGKPVVLATWKGSNPDLQGILLNSHYDVVPVMQECWTYPAFGATLAENGRIYARGTQDMKCVCVQYLLAIARLKKNNQTPLRNIHLLYVPDEEIGGQDGMQKFLESKEWTSLDIGVALDEGLANPDNAYSVFYGERTPWFLYVTATGPTGHGSR